MATAESLTTPPSSSIARHCWNLDAPDFVPGKPSPKAATSWADLLSEKIRQLSRSSSQNEQPAAVRAAIADLLRDRRTPPADPDTLAEAAFAAESPGPAAALLSALALAAPHVLPLPALLRVAARHSADLRSAIAADGAARLRDDPGAARRLLALAHLLASHRDTKQLAPHLLAPLAETAKVGEAASADPAAAAAAFRAVQAALMSAGRQLDASGDAQEVAGVYAQVRAALAAGAVGCARVAADLIALLEERAAGWGAGTAHSARGGVENGLENGNGEESWGSDCGGGDGMTEDMFTEFENFLRDSGQI